MVVLLWRGSRSMGDAAMIDARLKRRTGLIFVASIGMSIVLFGLTLALANVTYSATTVFGLTILIASGITSYFGLGHLIGAFNLSEFRSAMRRSA